jgi:hypothetical protein
MRVIQCLGIATTSKRLGQSFKLFTLHMCWYFDTLCLPIMQLVQHEKNKNTCILYNNKRIKSTCFIELDVLFEGSRLLLDHESPSNIIFNWSL